MYELKVEMEYLRRKRVQKFKAGLLLFKVKAKLGTNNNQNNKWEFTQRCVAPTVLREYKGNYSGYETESESI